MSIEKKSLISTLKTTKKANVVSGPAATNEGSATRKSAAIRKSAAVRKGAAVRKSAVRKAVINKMS